MNQEGVVLLGGRQGVNEETGKAAGLSHETIRKIGIIRKKAPQPIIDKVVKGQWKTDKAYRYLQKEEKKQELLAEASNITKLPDGVKLIHGDFTQIGEEQIPSNSIPLIFTDPPYSEEELPKYKELGKLAMRILKPGGSLVTYLGEGYTDIVIEYLNASGLKFWMPITVRLAGNHAAVHSRKVFGYSKILLWFVKGDKLREGIPNSGYIPNLIESTTPDKLLHNKGLEQSTTEAEFIIKYLTLPNEMVLDCMCGTGTTGVAALKLGRQFIGIDIDENECKNADINIRRYCIGEQSKP